MLLLDFFILFSAKQVLAFFWCDIAELPRIFLQHTYLSNLLYLCFLFFLFWAASKAKRPYQFSGKITVKAKEKSYSKLEIPYQAEVLEG